MIAQQQLYRFELAVFDPHNGKVISCREYLELRNTASISWVPEVEDSALFLTAEEREWMGDEWNLGNIRDIVSQLVHVKERLEKGEQAILRSAVLDQPSPPYFLFQPDSAKEVSMVLISMFFILEFPMGVYFPIDNGAGDHSEKLYSFVEQHRNKLLSDDPFPTPGQPPLKQVQFPNTALLEALREQIALGQKVISVIDLSTG
jgi:hypothetical protein